RQVEVRAEHFQNAVALGPQHERARFIGPGDAVEVEDAGQLALAGMREDDRGLGRPGDDAGGRSHDGRGEPVIVVLVGSGLKDGTLTRPAPNGRGLDAGAFWAGVWV